MSRRWHRSNAPPPRAVTTLERGWPEPRAGFGADALDYWTVFNGLLPGGAWRFIRCDGKRAIETWPEYQRTNVRERTRELRGYRGNIGYPCGRQPGGWWLVVIDVDPRVPGAAESLVTLRERGMTLETVTVITGGEVQGAHYWFASDVPVRKASLPEFPGVDFLAEGALVIVPPSITVHRYEFEHAWAIGDVDIAPLPAFITEALTHGRVQHTHDVPEALAEARGLLERLGGHGYTEHTDNGAIWASVCRPGKAPDRAGAATIGKLGNPGAVHVFSTNWSGLPAGAYDVRTLRRLAGVPQPERAIIESIPVAEEPPPPTPVPLDTDAELPPFPVEVFPEWVRTFVEQLATATQTPVDLPAMIVLAALAAASGGRILAVPRSGWEEPTNLFVAVAMPPASRKSPVFRPVVEPLRLAERVLIEGTRESIAAARAEKSAAEQRARTLLAEAAKAKGDEATDKREQAVAAQLFADAVNIPTLPRILASDATPEALVSLLATYGGRIAVMSAEGGVFDQIAGRYSAKPALDVYLNGHAGDALHVDRIGRPPDFIARPALTIGITTQPSTFRALAGVHDIKGRGLLGRFLWALPQSNIGYRETSPPPLDDIVRDAYTERLAAIAQSLAGWETDPFRVTFNVPAAVLVDQYQTATEVLLRDDGTLGHVREWGGKRVGTAVRIATLLHLARHEGEAWRSAVTPPDVEGAITVTDYLTAHALAVFAFMRREAAHDDAHAVLTFGRTQRAPWSVRDAHRALQARMTAAEVRAAVGHLIETDNVTEVPPKPRTGAGRPAPSRYVVNRGDTPDTLTH